MKVLFLEVDTESDWAVASIGPAFLAAYLRQHGHEVSMVRAAREPDVEDLAQRINAVQPGLVGVSLTTRQWQTARRYLGQLRGKIAAPVIAGGLHPTFSPENTLDHPGVDFLCLGEGEQALLELVQELELHGRPTRSIDNIWVKGGLRPKLRPPFSPPDDLPFMARDMLDERYGVVHMSTQRGCPFPCTYCAAGQYNQLYGKNSLYGRRRSQENVCRELEAVRRDGSLNYVMFLDDTFTIYPTWVEEFCRIYGPRLRVPFSLHARADTVSPEMIAQLAKAGCRHIVYGVESGSIRIREQVMQRPITNQRMIDVFQWTRDAGMMATANYMLGLPEETHEDLEQTLSLHEQLRPDDFGYFVFYPYPGTRLYHICLERGYIPDDYLDRPANHRQSILRLPTLTPDEIAAYYDRFTALREADSLRRLPQTAAPSAAAAVRQSIRHLASIG